MLFINAVLLLLILLFTGFFSFHEVYRNRDLYKRGNDNPNTIIWHRLKWGVQTTFFALVGLLNWPLALAGYVFYWLMHDVIGNPLTFPEDHRSIFYMGRWNASDKWFSRVLVKLPSPGVWLFIGKCLLQAISLFVCFKLHAFSRLFLLSFPAR